MLYIYGIDGLVPVDGNAGHLGRHRWKGNIMFKNHDTFAAVIGTAIVWAPPGN
jgi:hypothetical protein